MAYVRRVCVNGDNSGKLLRSCLITVLLDMLKARLSYLSRTLSSLTFASHLRHSNHRIDVECPLKH